MRRGRVGRGAAWCERHCGNSNVLQGISAPLPNNPLWATALPAADGHAELPLVGGQCEPLPLVLAYCGRGQGQKAGARVRGSPFRTRYAACAPLRRPGAPNLPAEGVARQTGASGRRGATIRELSTSAPGPARPGPPSGTRRQARAPPGWGTGTSQPSAWRSRCPPLRGTRVRAPPKSGASPQP